MVDTTEGNEDETTLSKKPRLSIACNECRRRKVKCDAEYPKCRNCLLRDAECVTTDLRRGEKLAAREWVQQPSASIAARPSGNRRASNQARVLFNPGSEHANDRFSLAPTAPAQADQNQQRAYADTPSTANISMPHDTEVSSIGISPVHQPLGNSYNYDTSSKKTKVQGPSSSQCLSRSLDVFFRSADFEPITPLFLHGMRHVEEMAVEASMEWPEMPGNEARELYVSTFSSRVLPLFPVVVVDQLKSDIALLVARPRFNDIQSEQIPMLITIYLVFSLGVDEAAQRPTKLGDQFLRAAASRMSYLILTPYIQSLQCLLLFTVAFRGRNKDGLGWQTLGMAIRMAQSLGLHDTHPYPATDSNRSQQDHDAQLHQYRLWTTCCFLEGMMQLESGRPSSLSVLDIENVLHDRDFRGQHSQNNAILKWMTELAHFQQRISQHIYAYRPGSRSARQLLFDTAELDQALTAWVDTIPNRYRPSTELSCTDDDLPSAALLGIQYHQTMIALHRAALIAPATSFDIEISSLLPNHPSQFRVRKGETICVNSSRAIARTAIDLDDRKAGSRALNVGPILLACIVLAIALMKEPTSRLRAADLSLLKACAEFFHEECLRCDMDSVFAQAPLKIYQQVNTYHKARRERRLGERSVVIEKATNSLTEEGVAPQSQAEAVRSLPADALLPLQRQSVDDAQNNAFATTAHLENEFRGPLLADSVDNSYSGQHRDLFNSIEHADGPFDGLNFEDLWNWMLVTDATAYPKNDIEWLHDAH